MFDPERHASIYTEGQTVMAAVRAPVWPATHWRCVVSRALARRIAGRMGSAGALASTSPSRVDRGGGRYGQNACIAFNFTRVSEEAVGSPG
jgi:hypothetical protein